MKGAILSQNPILAKGAHRAGVVILFPAELSHDQAVTVSSFHSGTNQ